MSKEKRLVFYIDAYSPETIPMAKLAEYMADFAALLGRDNAVHFAGLEKGSTKIAALVEYEDFPKVQTRLANISRGNWDKETAKLFDQIDHRLSNDNAIGRVYFEDVLISVGGKDETIVQGQQAADMVVFPGRTKPKPQSYGPFNQDGHLDGVLISVGGKDETISLRLQNGELVYSNCETNRTLARQLAKHLFEPVRIHGTGRWIREVSGQWTLLKFRVQSFDVLAADSLKATVAALRGVRGSGWSDIKDPLSELEDMRRDDDRELH
jgi:hypothetical protein